MPLPQTPAAGGSVRLHREWSGWFGTDVANTLNSRLGSNAHGLIQGTLLDEFYTHGRLAQVPPTLLLQGTLSCAYGLRPRVACGHHGAGGSFSSGLLRLLPRLEYQQHLPRGWVSL